MKLKRKLTKINLDLIFACARTKKASAIVSECGTKSLSQMVKILKSGECSDRTAFLFAKTYKRPLYEICPRPVESRIPDNADDLRRLSYGYFIDQDRELDFANAAGEEKKNPKESKCSKGKEEKLPAIELVWFEEMFVFSEEDSTVSAWGLQLRGRIQSRQGEGFEFIFNRISDHLYVLSARNGNGKAAFSATFTHRIGNHLCGVWVGVPATTSADTAVYRMILSSEKLDRKTLKRISESHLIQPLFEAENKFGEPRVVGKSDGELGGEGVTRFRRERQSREG